jgi:hypothetical protein
MEQTEKYKLKDIKMLLPNGKKITFSSMRALREFMHSSLIDRP